METLKCGLQQEMCDVAVRSKYMLRMRALNTAPRGLDAAKRRLGLAARCSTRFRALNRVAAAAAGSRRRFARGQPQRTRLG